MSLRFDAFEVDLTSGELRNGGIRVRLQRQPFVVLAALLERPGELVTREELRRRLWSDVSFMDFDHGINVAVKKLRAALNDSPDAPRYIETLAGKGYRFIASVESAADVASSAVVEPPSAIAHGKNRWRIPAIAAIAVIAALSVGAIYQWRGSPSKERATLLFSSPALLDDLAFSPDGQALAFVSVDATSPPTIYLKGLGIDPPRRLTDDADAGHRENGPAWIPDGSGISYLRRGNGSPTTLYAVPISGGTPRKLAEVGPVRGYSWAADSQSLAISAVDADGLGSIYKFSLATRQRARLTTPAKLLSNKVVGVAGDAFPKHSPDGKWIAFARRLPNGVALMVMTENGERLREVAAPEFVFDTVPMSLSPGFAWSRDSRGILFVGKGETPFPVLCQVDLSGGRPTVVSSTRAGAGIQQLAVAANGARLAYTIPTPRSTIWRYAMRKGQAPSPELPVARSAHLQSNPDFSPDGSRFAFSSNRSGTWQIYVSDREGKTPRQLTSLGGAGAGWPRWSPDGKQIAFDARPAGRAQVYVIDAEGGTPASLTEGISGEAEMPEWSPDGTWIYYTVLDANGSSAIWKMRATGGSNTRVTSFPGAFGAFPSPDGSRLFVGNRSGLPHSVPLDGGSAVEVAALRGARPGSMAIARSGIYFIVQAPGARIHNQVMYYDFATGRAQPLGLLSAPTLSPAIAVSRDEDHLLITQVDEDMSQIMLVEGFH